MLRREPWSFNEWFIALQRWEDFHDLDFLTFIDIWVQIRGIPLPNVSYKTVTSIANTLGEIKDLDFDEETSSQISFIRVKMRIGIIDRLHFFRTIRFQSGESAMIESEYESL